MGNWIKTKAASLLFAAAAAVYSDGLVRAMAAEKETPAPPATDKSTKSAKGKPVTKPAEKAEADEAEKKDDAAPLDPFADAPAPTPVSSGDAAGEPLTAEDVNVSDTGLVEIHVNDANLGEVLRMLSAQLERNIMASKEVRGTVTANLYDVTVKEALEAILRANECGYREQGNVIYVYTKKELEQIEKDERKTVTETFRVYYTPAANAVNMIKPVLSAEAQVSFTTPATSGIESSGGKDAGGNSHATEDTIVITDYPERIEQVRKVLKEVDRRPQQILVEAVILRATLNETNELGVDFSVLGGVDFSNLPGLQPVIGTQGIAGELADKGFAAAQAGGSGLKVGIVTNNVSVFVNALEGVTDTAVVANPKVMVLNKQPGSVHVGARLGYRTAVSTETLTADDVKFLEIGTRLNFRPYIANDGYIRMEISPKDSSGSVNSQGLPSEFVTEVTTNVMIRDGRTIVIGGLFRESSDSTKSQVPGLGNLPLAGPLFRKQRDSTIREEVIILLTPHIIKDEDVYEQASAEEMKHIERLRVGTRRGMMPWGRERLAESAYEAAVKELAKATPDRKKALWHLDCATNLNPKFTEAIELKAQLTGEEVTSADNSTIKSFVQRMALADRRKPATTMPSDAAIEEAAMPQAPAAKEVAKPVTAAPTTKPAAKVAAAAPKPTTRPTTKPGTDVADAATRVTAPAGFDKKSVVEVDLDALELE